MAIPILTPGFTVLSTCDASTGWSAGVVDTEVLKQGTAALSGILRTAGLNSRTFTATTFNSTGQHLRLWLNYAAIGFLQTKINGGIRLFMQDTGGDIGYWYLAGLDTYPGGWILLQVDMDTPFDSEVGAVDRANINRVGFTLNLTGAPRNATNTWFDYLVRGNGLTITGGTALDPVKWRDIAVADSAAGYGAVREQNSVFFVNTNLIFGGASDIYFEDDNQIVVFEDQPVDPDLYKIEALGAGFTSWKLTNTLLKSATTTVRFDLLMSAATIDAFEFVGNTVVNADLTQFKAAQTIIGCVFHGCEQITPSTAAFETNTVRKSTDADGALLWPGGTTVKDTLFTGNTVGIELDAAGAKDFIGIRFADNATDVTNTSGVAITVNVSGGGTAAGVTTSGSAVSMQSAATLTLIGVQDNSEVRIYAAGTATELYGLENKLTGINPAYSYTTPQVVDIVVLHVDYQYFRLANFSTAATDASLPVSQIFDRNYANP